MSELTSESREAGRADGGPSPIVAVLLWLWVLIPFGYGLFQLVTKIPALFGS